MNLHRDLVELESMMRDLESDLVEPKSLRGDAPTRIRQAVCAFTNDLPEPIFDLAVADGAMGSHAVAVGEAFKDFEGINAGDLAAHESRRSPSDWLTS